MLKPAPERHSAVNLPKVNDADFARATDHSCNPLKGVYFEYGFGNEAPVAEPKKIGLTLERICRLMVEQELLEEPLSFFPPQSFSLGSAAESKLSDPDLAALTLKETFSERLHGLVKDQNNLTLKDLEVIRAVGENLLEEIALSDDLQISTADVTKSVDHLYSALAVGAKELEHPPAA
jgi:hypothetical protein